MDYKEIADQIIITIGGQDNVKYVTHCVTRLRFVLKNKNLVNQDKINEIDGVLGSTFGAGQFQIIMGKNLSATFTQVVKNYNFEVAEIIDEILDEDIKEKDDSPIWKRGIKNIFNFLSACVTPMIPGLTVAGLIKVFLVLTSLAWPEIVDNQTYLVINGIVNTSFYFMPVFVAYGAAIRLGSTPIYSMIVASLGALGGVLPFVIMSGMHTVFGPVMMQSIASLGYEGFLRPTQFVHNVAEGGACFGVALKTKNPELRSQAISSGVGAILAGVSEPAIYGINLRLKKPMYGVMAGGAVGGCIAGFFGVKAFAYGNPSILALPIYGETIIGVIIAIIAAFVVSSVVSYFSGFEDVPVKNKNFQQNSH